MADHSPRSYFSSAGTVFYTPTPRTAKPEPRLPNPPCRPRPRRPHSIHITRLPAGFIPFDLRPSPPPILTGRSPSRFSLQLPKLERSASRGKAKRYLGSVFGFTLSSPSVAAGTAISAAPEMSRAQSMTLSNTLASTTARTPRSPRPGDRLSTPGGPHVHEEVNDRRSTMSSVASSNMQAMATTTESPEAEKPVCSGNGIACYMVLAEPVIFLSGLDHDGTTRDSGSSKSALLRGKLQINVTKSSKIKSITLKFTGRARTEWAEGIPPEKIATFEEDSLRTEHVPFFNAQYEGSDSGYGLMCTFTPRGSTSAADSTSTSSSSGTSSFSISRLGRGGKSTADLTTKRLSLQSNQSRSFQKGDSPYGPTPQMKGYKVFHPGVYEYSFELPIDNNSPETTKLPNASVKWKLEALIERAGTFKPNLQGFKEVPVVRAPSPDSLELSEPISISRTWEDQLYYQIMISGKSFPIGSKIPIAFKLTPLAKVQVHKVKVYLTEICEYWTGNRLVTRKDAPRKILILEKTAGRELSKEFASSEIRFLEGGEKTPEERQQDRRRVEYARQQEAERRGTLPEPLPDQTSNLLGDLDLGLEKYACMTEMEMNVQIPTCEMMKKHPEKRINHDCTWKNVTMHHWIKIIMRISRADETDPKKRRHFEISIDSPITFLDCKATTVNLALPEYSSQADAGPSQQRTCGCPNASTTSPLVPSLDGMQTSARPETYTPALTRPPAAHLAHAAAAVQRPMHLLRSPSFSPPDFDADDPPPPMPESRLPETMPMPTPPPMYDHIIGTPSHDGLADYFTRFNEQYDADANEADDEDIVRATERGRVNIPNPRTPGGRLARSMDIDRDFMFNPGAFDTRLTRQSEESNPQEPEIRRVIPASNTRASLDDARSQITLEDGNLYKLQSGIEHAFSRAAIQ